MTRKEKRQLLEQLEAVASLSILDRFKLRLVCRRHEYVLDELADHIQASAGVTGVFADLLKWIAENPEDALAFVMFIIDLFSGND